jgi:hypothetical protein
VSSAYDIIFHSYFFAPDACHLGWRLDCNTTAALHCFDCTPYFSCQLLVRGQGVSSVIPVVSTVLAIPSWTLLQCCMLGTSLSCNDCPACHAMMAHTAHTPHVTHTVPFWRMMHACFVLSVHNTICTHSTESTQTPVQALRQSSTAHVLPYSRPAAALLAFQASRPLTATVHSRDSYCTQQKKPPLPLQKAQAVETLHPLGFIRAALAHSYPGHMVPES